MKCPRCGERIQGLELNSGQEYADWICGSCEDEEDQEQPDVLTDHRRDDDCHCEIVDDDGTPNCQRCGGRV